MASNRKFNVPINLLSLASDPASADEGDVYYNTTDDRIRVYKNGTWVNLAYSDDVAITSTDYISFDTTPETSSTNPGTISWDADFETLKVQLDSGVDLQIGQEQVFRVKNASASVAIPKGKAVMFAGATGDTVTVTLADASNALTTPSDYLVGITAEEITADGFGFVTQFGFINQLNTNSFTLGQLLYVDASTAGNLTSTQPSAPAWQKPIAAVTRVSDTAGRILVRALPGVAIKNLEGTSIDASPADNEVLAYNSATGTWINQTSAEAGLIDTSSTAQTKTGNFTAPEIHATTKLVAETVGGDEGGEILLGVPATNTTIAGTGVTIDVWQNRLRFFEQGGDARGYYIDITGGSAGVGTNLVGGGATSDSFKTISVSGQSDVVADSSTDTLTLVAGSNVTITTNATSDSITIAATDTNTVTNAFTTISTPSGTSPVADSTSDTLTLSAGTGITITGDSSTDTITIASTITDTNTTYDLTTSGTSTATVSLAGSDATTDSFTITGGGATTVSHSAGAITISSTDTNTTYTASNGVTLSGTDIQHADTSTQSSVNNSGNTFIQDITLDGYGHITNINSGTVSFSSYAALAGATFTGDVSGTNITLSGDIAVNGGDITTTNTTATLFNTNATTLSIGGAATTFNIGPASNTSTTINIGPSGTALATINIGNSSFDAAINIGTNVGTASDITIGSSTYTTLGLRGSTINIVGGAVVNGELSSNGTTDTLDSTNNGFYFSSSDQFTFAASITAGDTTPVMRINRNTSDGNILRFAQAGTVEGTVSVSGTTVTYGTFAGIHWSQFANHAKPEILPGTVLETIDEMCDWQKEDGTYEDNDQLPKVKVSDNNESSSVYGVFMTWDGEDEYNDMHVLSLGAWLCRIDANETVQIGDLLVSAGNGCAKVQSDDIIRSKTIGKVTSTIRHSTYEDGSYLVPTVFYCG